MVGHVWRLGHFGKIDRKSALTGCRYFCREVLEHHSFIHNVRRNNLNEIWAESLVFVHYNLRLLTHYCDWARDDTSYMTWDNNPQGDSLEDVVLHLEELETKVLKDDDEATTTTIPPPSSCSSG